MRRLTGRVAALALLVVVTTVFSVASAQAQSLAPTRGKGPTPSLVKGFNVVVGNPYKTRMTFLLTVMDPTFTNPAPNSVVQPASVTLAPGYSRPVIVAFKLNPNAKERTIGLCITPEKIAGPIRPRVCGTYTGVRLKGAGG